MDDLDKLLNDLQASEPIVISNPQSESLLKELDNIEGSFLNDKKTTHKPRAAELTSSNRDKLKQSKVALEKSMDALAKNAKICASCQQPILKGGSVVNGKSYHSEHFTCNICKKSLKGVLVFDKEDVLWCEKDYHKKFSPECFFCKEPIKEDNGIEALGTTFHPDHFFCAQCGESLVNQTFMEYQGKAFCAEDYASLFATRCAHCLQPLLEDHISALSKNYHKDHFICSTADCGKVLSLNGFYHQDNLPYCEFHFYQLSDNLCVACNGIIMGRCVVAFGKKFHTSHFKCAFCTKELDGTVGGYKEKGEKPYCFQCYVKIFS